VIIRFVEIEGIVDYYFLNFHFLMNKYIFRYWWMFIFSVFT